MMKGQKVLRIVHRFRQPLILIILCAVLGSLLPGMFLTRSNLTSILFQVSLIGIMVCGATLPVFVGGIDRTVSAVAALAGAVCGTIIVNSGFTTQGVILGISVALAMGGISGLIHGLIVAYLKIPAFLLTLATSLVIYGLVQTITNNQLITIMNPPAFTNIGSRTVFGVPMPVYILFACFLTVFFIMHKTTYGRRLYSVGGNEEASKLSGINVKRTVVIAYIMSGLMSAICGIVLTSMIQQASSFAAQGYENDVLASIVVGGVSLQGGSGTIAGALFGTLLIGILNNGLRLLGVNAIYHSFITGLIIIGAVAFDMYSSYKMSGLKRESFITRFFKRVNVKRENAL